MYDVSILAISTSSEPVPESSGPLLNVHVSKISMKSTTSGTRIKRIGCCPKKMTFDPFSFAIVQNE